jgi:hypothetical protein
MRPGRRIWASTPLWLAGPDAGSPTKAPASAGNLAEGRYRSIRPAPQIDNHEFWNIASRLDAAASMRVMSIFSEPVTALGWPGAWVGGPCDGIYDPIMGQHSIVDVDTTAVADEDWLSAGGRNWAAAALVPAVGFVVPRLAVDNTGTRGVIDGGAVPTLPFASVGAGIWTTWNVASPLGLWRDIDFGGVGANARWVIGGQSGGAPAVLTSFVPANVFAAPGTPPAFAPGFVFCVAHSHHYAADLYPQDPGNHVWLALTGTQASISVHATADVWTAPVLHAMPSWPIDVACSRLSGEWIAIGVDGTISRSMDGLVWVNAPLALPGSYVAPTTCRIATDGYGHWMALETDAIALTGMVWGSGDDGATWRRVYEEIVVANTAFGAVWYGGGQFFIATMDGFSVGAIHSSLRIAE